ncbi:MAG: ABC transporter permease subunit, partial [Holophagales bacterium]|nr:ABC transporter permease subunit [Holophagales bacterium]
MSSARFSRVRWIASCELRRHVRSFPYLVASLLLVVLSVSVSWLAHGEYRLLLESYEEASAENLAELGEVRVYSFLRPVVSSAPEPLAVFERGVSGTLGRSVEISPFEVPARANTVPSADPYLTRWLDLDVTAVTTMVWGLLALLLTFDISAVRSSRRREEVLRAHGGSAGAVFLGRLVGAGAALALALALTMTPPVVGLLVTGAFEPGSGSWMRVGSLYGVYLVFGALMLLLGAWISVRASSASRALAYALLAWLSLIFLWPWMAQGLGRAWLGIGSEPSGL